MRFADPEMIRKSEERAKMLTRLEWAAAGAGLVFLVLMCILTRTGNARTMVTATMAGTVVWGLGILAFRQLVSEKARAESRHLKNLAEKERTVRTGRITADPEEFRIPKSIRAVKVLLDTGEEILEEGNTWHDTYWGVDLKTGEGKNMLGSILMRVRNELRIKSNHEVEK